MTAEELTALGLPFADTSPETCLMAEAALEWLQTHTTLEFDASDAESVKGLPAGARLFLVKFTELQSASGGITSESIAGMSQSFDTANNNALLWQFARELLGDVLRSGVRFRPARRWSR